MYLTLISKLKYSTLSQKDINNLVEKCYKIAIHYFRCAHSRIYKVLSDDLKIEDVAIDAIAPLFTSGNENPLFLFASAVESWNTEIKTEKEALYFLNKIVSKRVEQHICHLYRQADPFFSKILDSINYIIKKNGYKKVNHYGSVYILKPDADKELIVPLTKEELLNIPSDLFVSKKELLVKIFDFGGFNAIPLNALVHRIKELETSDFLYQNDISSNETELQVNELTQKGLSAAVIKLISSYSRKNKLNDAETQSFKLTLSDMANDLKDGGVNPGLYDYLSVHIPAMSKEVYQSKYHNILEYLLKIMKKTIADELTN